MSASAATGNGRPPRIAIAAEAAPRNLAEALLAFHVRAPKLRRNATGEIEGRQFGYTSIDALLDDVEPILVDLDLLWTAKVTIHDGQAAALYEMKHVPSAESEEWIGPLPCVGPGPQNLGSAITYMRRYTLQAYLNLAAEDDGGATASPGLPQDKYAEAAAAHEAIAERLSVEEAGALQAAAEGLRATQIKLAMSACGVVVPDQFAVATAFDAVPQSKAAALTETLAGAAR